MCVCVSLSVCLLRSVCVNPSWQKDFGAKELYNTGCRRCVNAQAFSLGPSAGGVFYLLVMIVLIQMSDLRCLAPVYVLAILISLCRLKHVTTCRVYFTTQLLLHCMFMFQLF